MKKSLEHLPPEKRERLGGVVSTIREMCDEVEMIILFGSHARGDYRDEEDLKPDRKSGAVSDFDILVVCQSKELAKNAAFWHEVSEKCNGLDPDMPFRIISHDIAYLKKRLKEIHYFFSDIVREGCVLYETGKYQLNVNKELSPEQKYEIAQEHFEQWFPRAENFYEAYEFSFSKGHKITSFQLHQAAESCFKAFLLVFTNYVPHDHYLASANQQFRELLPDIEEIFPCDTPEARKRFENFDYSYIGARYDSKFEISKDDLKYFGGRVKHLLELTENLCKEKIKSYKAQ